MALSTSARERLLIHIVASYNPETFVWSQQINEGIIDGFKERGFLPGIDFDVVYHHMDCLVIKAHEDRQRVAEKILQQIAQDKPDLVFTCDDDALKYVGLQIETIPVVFNGVNGEPESYFVSGKLNSLERPGHNLTGVYQTSYFRQSIQLLEQIVGGIGRIGIITDRSTTGIRIVKSFEKERADFPVEVAEIYISDEFSEWQQKIAHWQNVVDAVFVFSPNALTDESGEPVPADEVIGWIAENSKLPDLSCWSFVIQQGLLLSAADHGRNQGLFAAFQGLQILEGKVPGDIPVMTPPEGVPAINMRRAQALGIQIPGGLIDVFLDVGIVYK